VIGLVLCQPLTKSAASDDLAGKGSNQAKAKLVSRIHATPYHALAFSPDGKLLATAEDDLRLYDLGTGRQLARAAWTTDSTCRHLTFSPDGRRMVSAHEGRLIGKPDFYVYLWEVSPENKLRRIAELLAREREATDYFTEVYHASFSPDSRTVVAGCADETIYLWDCATAKERLRVRGGVAAAFTGDGRTLLAVSHDGLIRRLDPASGKALPPGKDFERSDYIFTKGVAFAANGDRVAVWDHNQVLLLDARSGKRICRLTFPSESGRVTLSADGRYLIVADGGSGIWFFDAATGRELGWRKRENGAFGDAGIALTRNGKTLAWVEHEGHVEIRILEDILARCVKGPADAQSEPPDVPLQAELIARQDRYVLDLGKLTPEEFSAMPDFTIPSKPRVDLEFRVRNTGKQPITFFPDLDPTTFLAGAGALNITWPCQTFVGFPSDKPFPKPVTLGPGQRYSVRVTELQLFRSGSQCLWILPGEYSVYASCFMSVSPAPKRVKAESDGSGWITLRTPALKVKVVKAEK
jgi:outer membrane protein assembly factor BamB